MATYETHQPSDDDLRGMIRDTEREIFDEATSTEELDGTEAQTLAELSQAGGWDGGALPDSEIAARTMQGDPGGVNYDRPLQMETEQTLAADNYALRQQLNQVATAYNEHVATPQRQAAQEQRRQEAREHLQNRYGLYDLEMGMDGSAKLDRYIAENDARAQGEVDRIERSMEAAHQRYGRDFEDAYADLTNMAVNPLSSEIVKSICAGPDPGEALMRLHGNDLVRSQARSAPPPFMPRGYAPPQRASSRRPSEALDGGWGDESVEREVFDSAFDDEGWQY
jgi:hypothetical protein